MSQRATRSNKLSLLHLASQFILDASSSSSSSSSSASSSSSSLEPARSRQQVRSSSSKPKRTYQRIDNDARAKIIRYHRNHNFTPKEISVLMQLNMWSVLKVLCNYKKTGNFEQKKKGGSGKKFTAEQRKYLVEQQYADHEKTYQQLQTAFKAKFNKNIDCSTIKRIIVDENDYTTKMLIKVPIQRNLPVNIAKRKEYCVRMIMKEKKKLVFIDESPFHLHMRRSRGRSLRGRRAFSLVKGSRSDFSVSVLAAMCPTIGLMYYEISSHKNDGDRFCEFFANLLKNVLVFQSRSFEFVMDNAPIHQAKKLEDVLEGQRVDHTLTFLPPYSPQLNPIEYMFSSWKAAMRKIEKNINAKQPDLEKYIEESSASVKVATKAEGWYTQATKYYVHCAAGLPLDESYNPNTVE